MIKTSEENWKYRILMFIPFLIFFAIDGNFSIQSIVPAIVLLIFIDLVYRRVCKNKIAIIVIGLFVISTVGALIINLFINRELITNRTYIRIGYYAMILYVYFSLTKIKYTYTEIDSVFIANIICGVLVSIYLIFVNHIWFVNFLGIRHDKNLIGAILAVQGELAVIMLLTNSKKSIKIFSAISYIIIILGIFYSASRASILVCILGTVTILFFNLLQKVNSRNDRIKFIIKIFIISIICCGAFCFISAKMVVANENIQWYWNRYFINGFEDDSVVGRWDWWAEALRLWSDRPICGYGIGNVNVSGNSSAVSHNTYIDFVVDQGILGGIGFLIILSHSFSSVIKKKKTIYYGIIITVLLNIMILSATRSTYMWYNLILLYCVGNLKEIRNL